MSSNGKMVAFLRYKPWQTSLIFFGICVGNVISSKTDPGLEKDFENSFTESNCYAKAVYDELMRAIKIIKSGAVDFVDIMIQDETEIGNYGKLPQEEAGTNNSSKLSKEETVTDNSRKLPQDEDDYGNGEGGLQIPAIVPMIFKIVGSALALNSSGVTENSLGIIPEGLSNRLTSVLGSLANSILGPVKTSPRPPPPRRRRRSTTTTPASTTFNATTIPSDTFTGIPGIDDAEGISIVPETTTEVVPLIESASQSEVTTNTSDILEKEEITPTTPAEITSSTIPPTTTTDRLYKESLLGDNPVYAAAYAPNYVHTTPYPVYASNFLHVLYPAPTTPSTPSPTTSTDPNSYNIALPFDYQAPHENQFISPSSTVPIKQEIVTFDPNIATTPNNDYEEYEYEERHESEMDLVSSNAGLNKTGKASLHPQTTLRTEGGAFRSKNQQNAGVEDEDDEYLDNDSNKNRSLSSLGRISRLNRF